MAVPGRAMGNLHRLERGARIALGGVAISAAVIGLLFKSELLSTSPTYDRQSWYLVTEHAGFIVTSRLDDEAACRKLEKPASFCRSGSSLQEPLAGRRRGA